VLGLITATKANQTTPSPDIAVARIESKLPKPSIAKPKKPRDRPKSRPVEETLNEIAARDGWNPGGASSISSIEFLKDQKGLTLGRIAGKPEFSDYTKTPEGKEALRTVLKRLRTAAKKQRENV